MLLEDERHGTLFVVHMCMGMRFTRRRAETKGQNVHSGGHVGRMVLCGGDVA